MQFVQCTNGSHHVVPAKTGSEGDPFHRCTYQQGDGRLLVLKSPSVDEVKHKVPFFPLPATTDCGNGAHCWHNSGQVPKHYVVHRMTNTAEIQGMRCLQEACSDAAQPQLCVSDLPSAFPKQLCTDHCPHLSMQLSQKSFPSYPLVSLGVQQGEKSLLCKSAIPVKAVPAPALCMHYGSDGFQWGAVPEWHWSMAV